MSKKDSYDANLVFDKVCFCLTVVEQMNIANLVAYLIFKALALSVCANTSLAKRWLDLLNNSRTLSPFYLIKPNLPIPASPIGFLLHIISLPN